MKFYRYIKTYCLILVCATILTTSNICTDKVTAQTVVPQQATTVVCNPNSLPLEIVASPKSFLNKNVTFKARFDKFSTLGLDYKPAFKSSEEYISFLIKRDDTNFDIPLSELKLFIKRKEAEKHIDLKSNDEIQVSGIVFSDALDDAWIDVSNLILIKKATDNNGV
jgi:hypothetical protein